MYVYVCAVRGSGLSQVVVVVTLPGLATIQKYLLLLCLCEIFHPFFAAFITYHLSFVRLSPLTWIFLFCFESSRESLRSLSISESRLAAKKGFLSFYLLGSPPSPPLSLSFSQLARVKPCKKFLEYYTYLLETSYSIF